MNTIDQVYYINLDYRTDRRLQMEDWLEESGFPSEKVTRISSIRTPESGYFGACMGHMKAVEEFLKSNHKTCIIYEDDYIPLNPKTYWEHFSKLEEHHIHYDMVLCSYNVLESKETEVPWLHRVYKSLTMSGYLITRDFAPKLLENLKEGLGYLIEEAKKTNKIDHTYVNDVYWQKVMPLTMCYCFYPRIGKQHEGYSDIQNQHVDYVG